MTLRDLLTPSLTCFMLVAGVAIFVNSPLKSQPTQVTEAPLEILTLVPTETAIPTLTITGQPKKTSSTTSTTTKATVKAVPKPSPKPKPAPTCIVTINGRKYNVISLRRTHSGPRDIFVCGTDMTSTFKSQHGTNYSLIARYII